MVRTSVLMQGRRMANFGPHCPQILRPLKKVIPTAKRKLGARVLWSLRELITHSAAAIIMKSRDRMTCYLQSDRYNTCSGYKGKQLEFCVLTAAGYGCAGDGGCGHVNSISDPTVVSLEMVRSQASLPQKAFEELD